MMDEKRKELEKIWEIESEEKKDVLDEKGWV